MGLAFLGLLGGSWIFGPRETVTEPSVVPNADGLGIPGAPDALDDWLAESEAALGDVLPHATKSVVWADSSRKSKTETVVVYIHGFSATRQEVAPLPDSVAAQLGANLFYTRLAGHGRPGSTMGEAVPADWVADVSEAMGVAEQLGQNVVLMGTSTGGTLAAWAAFRKEWAPRIKALVLLSPNFAVQASGAWVFGMPWGGWLANRIAGSERSWDASNELQERYWTTTYPTDAIATMMAWLRHTDGLDYGAIQVPVWMGMSPDDQVVSPDAAERVFEAWGTSAKQLVWLEGGSDPSHHILAGDVLAPENTRMVARHIVEFVRATRR